MFRCFVEIRAYLQSSERCSWNRRAVLFHTVNGQVEAGVAGRGCSLMDFNSDGILSGIESFRRHPERPELVVVMCVRCPRVIYYLIVGRHVAANDFPAIQIDDGSVIPAQKKLNEIKRAVSRQGKRMTEIRRDMFVVRVRSVRDPGRLSIVAVSESRLA